ncbi:hypothetical protein COCNU_10G004860 [Cocos nucifera]|uniref:Kinesin motor domain-containing protein n=1 Tax=Cocos nucifera TaxID=13894 RepID=A0A8K0IM82_COCNU|nr:hypothetical protein COCNU_10G004860 [Cocos nucifera]
MGVATEDSFDSMILVSGSRLVQSGFRKMDCRDDVVMFVNSGGSPIEGRDSHINFLGDSYFQGGDVIKTNEAIVEGGDYPFLYQSARYGNFCYKFEALAPGDYFVDLHFAEIVNTYGPKGIRLFDILSELDVYAVVGANKPLQLVDIRVPVLDNGFIVIRFEGISGTPTVSGICIRKAPKLSAPLVKPEHLICNKCAAEIEVSPTQTRARSKYIAKYEKKIHELTSQYKLKSDECYEAWMSLTATNEQLVRLRMELDNYIFQTETLEQAVEKQTGKLRDVSERYEHDKKSWFAAISNLEDKIKAMKQGQSQLSIEAHECANSTPDLNKMIIAVQTLVTQCEDLKIKYSEEIAKRKKLYNQVQETKGNIRVFCRCRPLTKEEVLSGYTSMVDFDAAKEGDIGIMAGGSIKKIFKFDRVYTPKDGQADVYADASPLVTSVLDGYNVCIFAYGQTGTGKTFTMEGTEQNRGVNYRTLDELFKIAAERKETFAYNISVSVLEVYNEQIRDLLATFPSTKKLEVRQAAEGFHHVPGIVEAKVENIKQVWDVLQAGSNARAVGSNNVNEHSGDSKALMFVQISPSDNDLGETLSSLNFASRVRNIELGPARKQVDTGELQKMKQMLDKVKQESRIKDESLQKLEEHCQNLENKLRGKDQLCRNLQEKVKELECKLKEQLNSESVAVQKVKELEYKLKERLQSELMLEQKVNKLKNKLREKRDQSKSMLLLHSDDALKFATPTEGKAFSRDESTSETDPRILRSSNSVNKPLTGPGSILLQGAEPLHEIKRKRELRSTMVGKSENNIIVPTTLVEKRIQPSELGKVRKIDPTKAFGRLTRKVVATQKVFPHSRNNQEKDKIKVWTR